jgi:hypothetical protein
MLPSVPVDDPIATCTHGHPLTADNVVNEPGGKDRKVRPRCRTCKREAVARSRRRRSIGLGRQTTLAPRLKRDGVEVTTTAYETQRLAALIPKSMRDSIASAILDPMVYDLQRRVLQRVWDQRSWAGMNEDVAARVFIEALIEQTIDARSPHLRIDLILRAALTR